MTYNEAKEQLITDYPKYAGRKHDTSGLEYWANEIASGRQTIQSVRHILLDSEGLDRIWRKLNDLEQGGTGDCPTADDVIEEIIDRLEN